MMERAANWKLKSGSEVEVLTPALLAAITSRVTSRISPVQWTRTGSLKTVFTDIDAIDEK